MNEGGLSIDLQASMGAVPGEIPKNFCINVSIVVLIRIRRQGGRRPLEIVPYERRTVGPGFVLGLGFDWKQKRREDRECERSFANKGSTVVQENSRLSSECLNSLPHHIKNVEARQTPVSELRFMVRPNLACGSDSVRLIDLKLTLSSSYRADGVR